MIGKKIYFNYTVCEVKDGKASAQTLPGVGYVTGKNTMYYRYGKGLAGTFTWVNSKTLKVKAVDNIFTNSVRTEILTAK